MCTLYLKKCVFDYKIKVSVGQFCSGHYRLLTVETFFKISFLYSTKKSNRFAITLSRFNFWRTIPLKLTSCPACWTLVLTSSLTLLPPLVPSSLLAPLLHQSRPVNSLCSLRCHPYSHWLHLGLPSPQLNCGPLAPIGPPYK